MFNLTTHWLRSIGLLPTPRPKIYWSGHALFVSAAGTKMLMVHMLEATPHRRLN
jgi:hypothetical protein